jgi:ABC-2 type transport system permease protein
MNRLYLLTKTQILGGFSNTSNNKKKRVNPLLVLVIVSSLLSICYGFVLMLGFKELNNLDAGVYLMITVSALLSFTMSITKMSGAIFKSKDLDMLMTLPISNKMIISSKILSVYIVDLIETLILNIPMNIIYLAFGGSLNLFFKAMLSTIFIPLLPIALASFISFLITFLTAHTKHKNLFETIFYLLFIVLVFFLSFLLSFTGQNIAKDPSIADSFAKVNVAYPLLYFIEGNWLYMLYYILINVASFTLVVLLIAIFFLKINSLMVDNKTHLEYKIQNKEYNMSQSKSLLKKEFMQILKNGKVTINSFTGQLLCILVLFVMYFTTTKIPEEGAYIRIMIAFCLLLYMNAIQTGSVYEISMEGKSLEMLRALPIDSKEIIKAKIKASYIPTIFINLISGVIFIVLFKPSIFLAISSLILPSIVCLQTSLFGILFNLMWPKLDWDNEMQYLKNGKAILVQLFTTMFGSFFIMGAGVALSFIVNEYVGISIIYAIYLFIIFILYMYIRNNGNRLFARIFG